MFLHADHHDGFRIQFDQTAVGAVFQHFLAEGRLQDLTIGRQTVATLTAERWAELNLQVEFLSRLSQVGRLIGQAFQLLAGLDEQLLHFLRFEVTRQLVLEAGKARDIRSLNAQQLDQVPAKLATHWSGNLIELQLIQRLLESRVIHAWAGITQITTVFRGGRIVGELLGQRGEVFTGTDALGNLFNLGLGLLIAELVADLDQDVRRLTLLSERSDFLLIQGLQVIVLHFDLTEEGILLQLQIFKNYLLGTLVLGSVLVEIGLDVSLGNLDLGRVGLDGQGCESRASAFQAWRKPGLRHR